MAEKKIWFRFYKELNDFLPKKRKKVRFQIKYEQKQSVIRQLKPRTIICFDEFFKCSSCSKVYWKGSHFERMRKLIFELANVG